jgi:pseudaminic acid cytidylyltransferase
MLKPIALIPARAGSKRVPRKNFLEVDGKLMLERTIELVQQSGIFQKILVSSDDEQAEEIAKKNQIEYRFRRPGLASDASSVDQVCLDVIENDKSIELLCCIYATAILLKPNTIKESYELLVSDAIESLMGASKYNFSPVEAFEVLQDGRIKPLLPDWRGKKSQTFPQTCVSNGTFYWATARHLREHGSLISTETKPFYVPSNQVCDVNTPEDLVELLTIMNRKNEK